MYYITFGMKYSHEEHPVRSWVNPDGVVEVVAEQGRGIKLDKEVARNAAFSFFGQNFAFFNHGTPEPEFFPLGVHGKIILSTKDGEGRRPIMGAPGIYGWLIPPKYNTKKLEFLPEGGPQHLVYEVTHSPGDSPILGCYSSKRQAIEVVKAMADIREYNKAKGHGGNEENW